MDEMENISGVGKNKALKFGQPFIELIAEYVEENDIERPDDLVLKTVANKSGKKISIIQNIDKKLSIDDIARSHAFNGSRSYWTKWSALSTQAPSLDFHLLHRGAD